MTLTDEQTDRLKDAASQGAQLNDLQKIIQAEFGLSITYMDTRFLISDLGIDIQTEQPEQPAEEPAPAAEPAAPPVPAEAPLSPPQDLGSLPAAATSVQVNVDQVTRPGAMVNGSVTWSDGTHCSWAIDQMGGLALDAPDPGYQPTPADIEAFQTQLRQLLGG